MSAFLSLLFNQPISSSSSASVSSRPSPTTAEGMRQCWICFTEESMDGCFESPSNPKWVQPCRCSGTTAWVHQGCLLDWMDVKLRGGHPLGQPISCPQCHAKYQVADRYSLPYPILVAINALGRVTDRFLMYAALAGLCATGYGGLFGYGTSTFAAAIGPRNALLFFREHLGVLRAESIVKVFVGMPVIALGVLAGAFPTLSWVFPIIPPILYANDFIVWNQFSPKLLTLSLPFVLFAYRFGEVYFPKMILNALGRKNEDEDDDDDNNNLDGSEPTQQPRQDQSQIPTPNSSGLSEDTNTAASIGIEDERAIRVSVLSTTGVLILPFISALFGLVVFPTRILPFYRMILSGACIVAARDVLRALSWYQQVLIRPYRRVLSFNINSTNNNNNNKQE